MDDLRDVVETLSEFTWTFDYLSVAGYREIMPDRAARIRFGGGTCCVWIEEENPWMIEWDDEAIRHVQGDRDVIRRDVILAKLQSCA